MKSCFIFLKPELPYELLNQKLDVQNLCEVDIIIFEKYRKWINDPVEEKRALHMITENARLNDAVQT